jgi:hypothetical protein
VEQKFEVRLFVRVLLVMFSIVFKITITIHIHSSKFRCFSLFQLCFVMFSIVFKIPSQFTFSHPNFVVFRFVFCFCFCITNSYWKTAVDDRVVPNPSTPNETGLVKRLFQKLKNYFVRVFSRIVPDSDFYIYIFLSEVFCFVFLVFFPNNFSGLSDLKGTVVKEVFASNLIPTGYLLILLHQFVLIVVDRAIFLRQVIVLLLLRNFPVLFLFVVFFC